MSQLKDIIYMVWRQDVKYLNFALNLSEVSRNVVQLHHNGTLKQPFGMAANHLDVQVSASRQNWTHCLTCASTLESLGTAYSSSIIALIG